VTFATWNHLWLAEGFAEYGPVLAAELVPATGLNAAALRSSIKSTARGNTTQSVYLPDAAIATSNTIWTGTNISAVYERGAMVVSMLRKLCGDSLFFKALQNYMNDPALAYKSAVTDDLKNHFEAVLNHDMDEFFDSWVYKRSHADYTVNWANKGNQLIVSMGTQTKGANSNETYYYTPVVIRVRNAANTKDTTIVFYDQNKQLAKAGRGISAAKSTVLKYDLSFTPAAVTVDPNNETLSTGTAAFLSTLDIDILSFSGKAKASTNELSLVIAATDEKSTLIAERSEDGTRFYPVGHFVLSGNTGEGTEYHFTDNAIAAGHTYYYRAKTIDETGDVKYTSIVRLANAGGQQDVQLLPNLVRDHFRLSLPVQWQSGTVHLTVYNSAGVVVKRDLLRNAGPVVPVAVGQLPAGAYRLELQGSVGRHTVKPFTIVR
jgi:hypothetical protein